MEHADFASIVERVWNQMPTGGNMHMVWSKLKALKMELKELNTFMELYRIHLSKARKKLEVIQSQLKINCMDQDLIDQEKRVLMKVEKWSNIEEQILHQKSREQWIACGDSNTKYFHAQLKMRTNISTINSIYNEVGNKLCDPIQVEEEFTKYFKKILGKAILLVNVQTLKLSIRAPVLICSKKKN